MLILLCGLVSPQIASATIYQPGATLEPDCAPGSANCGVAVTTSYLGTTTPIGNSLLTIQATTTGSILATLRAFAGQVANLFQIQDSSGSNLFSINASGVLTLGSLNGLLQANSGVVSATSSIGVLYGGTGLTSAPSYGNILVGNSSGGYTLTATSSLGLGGSSGTVTSVALTAPTGLTVTGSPITTSGTLALSLTSGYNIPLTASTTEYDTSYSNRITSASSPLSITNHVISLSTAGDWTGTFDGQEGSFYLDARNLSNFGTPFYTFFNATTSDALSEGSTNQYFTSTRFNNSFDTRFAATTTTGLAEGSNLYFTNNRVASVIAGTTTDAITQGSTNRYYAESLVQSFIHASSTIPKTYTANIFTGGNIFNGGLTIDSLNGLLQANSGVVSATSSIGVLYGGTGLTSAPSYGNILVGNSSGGYTLTATSSLGLSSGGASTGSANTWTGLQQFQAGASTTLFSSYGPAYFGGTATSSFSSTGALTLASALTVGNGGTGLISLTPGDIIYADSATSFARVASSTGGKILQLDFTTGAPSWVATSTLGLGGSSGTVSSVNASGGTTGLSFSGGPVTTSGTLTLAGILNTANGGTGWSTIQSGALLYGNDTGALATTTAGTAGNVIALLNGVPTWTATTTLSTISGTLGATQGGTGLTSLTPGDLIYANGANSFARVASSTGGKIFQIDFTTGAPSWVATSTLGLGGSGASLSTANIWTALQQFQAGASTTVLSVYNGAYFGATATSSFSSTGALTLVSALGVGSGGTGAASFGQGWLFSSGDGNALSASTSPTVNYITATSTTATSTFANGINITGGCFSVNGVCMSGGGGGSGTGYTIVEKTADESITSDATLSNDADLHFSASANTAYIVEFIIRYHSSSATPDFKYTITGPTGAIFRGIGLAYDGSSDTGNVNIDACNIESITTLCTIVGTQAPDFLIHITGIMEVQGTAGTVAFQWAQNGSNATATIVDQDSILRYLTLSGASGADLAELYSTNDTSIEAGDVVSLDVSLQAGVKKSQTPRDQNVIGIVSTNPGLTIGGADNEGITMVPVALSGRVPVKVIIENGAILPGDYLTSSSVPGVAMKSNGIGPVIGQALSVYDGNGMGVVVALVKNFDFGENALLMGDISPKVNADESDNGLFTFVSAIQSEVAHDPIAVLSKKITDGLQFLTDFVVARVTAIRGYFDEIFANITHQKTLCVGDAENGGETCVTKTEFDALLENANVHAAASAAAASGSGSSFDSAAGSAATSAGTSTGDTSVGDSATSTSSTDSSATSTATETATDTPLTAPDLPAGEAGAIAPVVSAPTPTPVPEAVVTPEPQGEADPPPAPVDLPAEDSAQAGTSVDIPAIESLVSPAPDPSPDATESTATERHHRR